MSRLTRERTTEPDSRDQTLRHVRGQGNIYFLFSADHEQDWKPYPVDPYSAIICDDHTYIHTYTTLVNPCAGSNLRNAARDVEKHLADAVERKKNKYRGSFSATYSLLPLAMPTCGEVGSDVHARIKELAIRRVQHRSETHSNESQHLTEGTKVARLRRRFSFVLQQALSFRTRHHL